MSNKLMKKRYIIWGICAVSIACSITACVNKQEDFSESISNNMMEEINSQADIREEDLYEESMLDEGRNQDYISDRIFCANRWEVQITNEEWEEILNAFEQLEKTESILPKENGEELAYVRFMIEGEGHDIVHIKGEYESYILVDYQTEYNCTDEFLEIFERYCSDEQEVSGENEKVSPKERLVGLSIKCEEPLTDEEYLDTARRVVALWLDSLKSEEGEYKLKRYAFTNERVGDRAVQGDGYVNGGREFVCYVGFSAEKDEDTVFYASGTYDTFYNYYCGPGVYARFRWDNGVCTLIDYESASDLISGGRLKDGLYGINEEQAEYATFYDFLNDKSNVEKWINEDVKRSSSDILLSHNVMMLSNGEIIFLDIGADSENTIDGDMITAIMYDYFYDSYGNPRYSSPVDFIDDIGQVVMTYTMEFPIVFDDYNHDGNPDYAIRIATDENGSKYSVECMDLRGTPWEDGGEIYLYGEFDESVRLQVSDSGKILNKVCDENGKMTYEESSLVRDISNTYHDIVSENESIDYRMYSQKFYLPNDLRMYGENDDKIICYFWNNTEEKVTVGGRYHIERKNGDIWENVSSGKSISNVTVDAGKCAELSFDISDIGNNEAALYRVKIMAGETNVYGGFYYGSEIKPNIEIEAAQYPTGINAITFDVKNVGMSTVYPNLVELYLGTEKIYEKDISKIECINVNESEEISISSHNMGQAFEEGEYTIKIIVDGEEFSENVTVKEVPSDRLFYFPKEVMAEKCFTGIKFSLENNIWNEEMAKITCIDDVQVLRDGAWYEAPYVSKEFNRYSSNVLEIEYGQNALVEMGKMSFGEYLSDGANVVIPETGDLCRVCVYFTKSSGKGEYVYFYMP